MSTRIGISRKKRKKLRAGEKGLSWDYFDPKGKLITNPKIIDRCNKLVLPPAWEDVWISLDSESDLQATGMDAKGRLQYRYHANWIQARAEEKFAGLVDFAFILPVIRKRVEKDLSLKGMPKDKVVALVVRLMDLYHIRVGNDEYARKNKSYGLTTLKEGHMKIDRSNTAEGELDAILEFRGKSGKDWKIRIWEDDLAKLIDASGKVGGRHKSQDLFRYEDSSGNDFDIKSHHINEYLDSITPSTNKVTAKDFRTWAATWKMGSRLSVQLDPETITARKRVATQIIKTVASDLGNTVAVCRSSYIHPVILTDWNDGKFRQKWNQAKSNRKVKYLSKDEVVITKYLDQ